MRMLQPSAVVIVVLVVGLLTPGCRDAPTGVVEDSAAPMEDGAGKNAPDREDALQIFNRDVYFLDHVTLRNPTADTPGDAALYSVVGALLPVNWGEWQRAAGTAVTHAGGKYTDVSMFLTGLIPGGVYSVFYVTFAPDSEHPLCPGVERSLPLTSRDKKQAPDPSSFVADASGAAAYHARVEGDLLSAGQLVFSIVYHFDGMTYHPFPNRGEFFTHDSESGCRSTYGEDAMRHLLILQKL